jgi:PAS domain S-box-containing protein
MESSSVSRMGGDDFVASFSFQRQRLLAHAGSLLAVSPADVAPDPDTVSKLAQTVVSSLEILKVAEQELVDERRRHATLEESLERQVAHFRAMFHLAPTPLLLTTTDTSVREINAAAGRLIGADADQLEGRQLSSLVPRGHQASFREQLVHMLEMKAVAAWSFTLEVQRNLPIGISATVETIDDPAVGARALYWNIRPLTV